jgi:hypothetical protein
LDLCITLSPRPRLPAPRHWPLPPQLRTSDNPLCTASDPPWERSYPAHGPRRASLPSLGSVRHHLRATHCGPILCTFGGLGPPNRRGDPTLSSWRPTTCKLQDFIFVECHEKTLGEDPRPKLALPADLCRICLEGAPAAPPLFPHPLVPWCGRSQDAPRGSPAARPEGCMSTTIPGNSVSMLE